MSDEQDIFILIHESLLRIEKLLANPPVTERRVAAPNPSHALTIEGVPANVSTNDHGFTNAKVNGLRVSTKKSPFSDKLYTAQDNNLAVRIVYTENHNGKYLNRYIASIDYLDAAATPAPAGAATVDDDDVPF